MSEEIKTPNEAPTPTPAAPRPEGPTGKSLSAQAPLRQEASALPLERAKTMGQRTFTQNITHEKATSTPNSLKRFRLEKVLGQGGMGEVDQMFDADINRTVAVKRLHAQLHDEGNIERFAREARTLGQLDHPNILTVHDVGLDEGGQYFFVMPLVKGETLDDVICQLRAGNREYHERYSFTRRLEVCAGIMDALAYAHALGVLHRDIKPENIMIGDHGEVLVMDWGLSKGLHRPEPEADKKDPQRIAAEQAPPLNQTRDDLLLGTPLYMSPEQAAAKNSELDVRTDIYSLSVLMYELMTLKHYLSNITDLNALLKAIQEAPQTPAVLVKHKAQSYVPIEISHLITRGLEKKPASRWQSASEMRLEIDGILSGRIRVQCPTTFTKRALFNVSTLLDRQFYLGFLVITLLAIFMVLNIVNFVFTMLG